MNDKSKPGLGSPALTGIGFEAEGTPEFIIACVRQHVREVGAYLPDGQRTLVIRATVSHPKPKKRRSTALARSRK